MSGVHVDRDELARLHRLGFSAPQIAVRLGCGERTVTRWRKSAGVDAPVPDYACHRVSAERLEAARRLLDDGLSIHDVSLTLRMSEATIRKYFPGAGWTREESGRFSAMVRRLNEIRVAS